MFNNRSGVTVFHWLMPFYFGLILLIGILIGQFCVDTSSARILLGSFFAVAGLYLAIRKQYIHDDFLFFILIIFSIYAGLSGIWQSHSLDPILHAGGLVIVYYLIRASTLKLSGNEIITLCERLGWITFLYTLINVVIILLPGHNHINFYSDHPYLGALSNPNGSADVLFIAFLISALATIICDRLIPKWFFAFSSVLLITLLVITESRSTIFSVAFVLTSLSLFTIINRKNINRRTKKSIFLISGFLLLSLLSICVVNDHSFSILGLPATSTENHAITHLYSSKMFNGRVEIWRQILLYMADQKRYLFGIGLGKQYLIMQLHNIPFAQAHNTFLDIFAGTGIIGLSLFLFFIVGIFAKMIKKFLGHRDVFSFYIVIATAAMLMHSMVESYLINQLSPDFFCFLLFYSLLITRPSIRS